MRKILAIVLAIALVGAGAIVLQTVAGGSDATGDAVSATASDGGTIAVVASSEGASGGDAEAEYAELMAELGKKGQQEGQGRTQPEVLAVLGEIENRLVEFRKAHPGTPEAADAGFQLGSLKTSMGQLTQEPSHYVEAASYLAAYILDAPVDAPQANLATAHYYLAEAYKATGKWDEAKREYEVVVNQYGLVNQRMTEFARTNLQDIDVQKKLAVGAAPLPFEVTSITGEKISPEKYKGKVLLIDFWATWCQPCIAEMPHVKKVYEKYREKGFEIVGISLDRSRSSLDSYIEANSIRWPQYFDGKFWNNDIAQQYGVRSIPATFLIGRDGKIRYKSLRGKQLEVAVEKLVSEKI